MNIRMSMLGGIRIVTAMVIAVGLGATALAQTRTANRIRSAISDTQVSRMQGNLSPLIRALPDRGPAANDLPMERMALVFKPTAEQQQKLDTLLEQQQDPSSPNYHRWLTPQQFGEQFGLSDEDFGKVASWLAGHGFTIVDQPASRTFIAFNGTAGQVAAAFHTVIRRYERHGRMHYANATEPALPSALADVVLGIHALNDFRLQPRTSVTVHPNFTSQSSGNHFLAPGDVATIYNVKGLYNAGVTGTGQRIVVVGQSSIVKDDIDKFRAAAELPAINLEDILVPGSADPGIVTGDVDESELDIEWSGAVAFNSSIVYVRAKKVFDALSYAVSQNLAPVISISYGTCEANFNKTDVSTISSWLQQANAQGQTVIAPAGDDGAADCDAGTPTTPSTTASHGLAVDAPASLPYATAVGGTRFDEGADPSVYWDGVVSSNPNGPTAKRYIPEVVWNDTAANGQLAATGGGASTLFSKPSWQTGVGVPNDGARDVPDISFAASSNHDGYLTCLQPRANFSGCVNSYRDSSGLLSVVGGTSVGVPVFAGVVALLNQKTGVSQGNLNSMLYSLAASSPSIFHDVTSGDNKVPCGAGSTGCPAGGGSIGFSAGPGYDQATGLGSLDVSALAAVWNPAPDFQGWFTPQSLVITRGNSATATLVLSPLRGFTGTVNLSCNVASPPGVTCSIPANASFGSNVNLTITAPGARSLSASLRTDGFHPFYGFAPGGMLFLAGVWLSGFRVRGKDRTLWTLLALGLLLGAIACGGGGGGPKASVNAGTGPGTVIVTATSGSISHAIPLNLTVN